MSLKDDHLNENEEIKQILELISPSNELDLDQANRSDVPPALKFTTFSSIAALNLSKNSLNALDPQVLLNLPNLCRLDLSNNRLVTLPPTLAAPRKLASLQLDNNRLQYLPDEVGEM